MLGCGTAGDTLLYIYDFYDPGAGGHFKRSRLARMTLNHGKWSFVQDALIDGTISGLDHA